MMSFESVKLLLLFTLLHYLVAQFVAPTEIPLNRLDHAPVLHFTLARRGGAVNSTEYMRDYVNLTTLTGQLEATENRFNLTRREVKGNRLVRKAKLRAHGDEHNGLLMGEVAGQGIWYAKVSIGSPPQEIEMDLNMLVSDFYVVTTSSRVGSRFDEFFSQSYVRSGQYLYPKCSLPTDHFYLPTVNASAPLAFAHCRPSKFSLNTLEASGSTLGLAPSESLSQTGSTSILKQLLEGEIIQRPIFSLMLINGREGVLSIGGTAASAIDLVVSQTRQELDHLGAVERGEEVGAEVTSPSLMKRNRAPKDVIPRQAEWEQGWAWNKVQGADGWWQILMQSVWIDGARVLQNQAVVLDINSPFILAPPLAAKAFYASVSGSYPLPAPYSNFYAFPCLNPPVLHFEFGGIRFPFMQGGRGADWTGLPGGRFSLGRLKSGSGYCVGAVVETRMGIKDDKIDQPRKGKTGGRSSAGIKNLAGNGMRDVWVIGEGFFRGIGGVFDFKDHRVGFRTF